MSGVIDLAVVASMACTASTTMSLAGYSHFATCPRPNSNRAIVVRTRQDGPLKKEGVQVLIDSAVVGKRSIEFNGEVLFVAAANGALAPAMALGSADVEVLGNRIDVVPPAVPTIEITFPTETMAQDWGAEFKESVTMGPPHDRIQELILHSVLVEKHMADLCGRAQGIEDLEKRNKKLKKELGLPDGNATNFTQGTGSSWFTSSSYCQPTEEDTLKDQVLEFRDKSERAQALAEDLRRKAAEHVHPDVHQAAHDKMQQHKEECTRAKDEVTKLQVRVDELTPASCGAQGQPSQGSTHVTEANLQQAVKQLEIRRTHLANDFAQRYKDVQMQLAASNRQVQDERTRADSRAALVQSLTQEKVGLMAQLEVLQKECSEGVSLAKALKKQADETPLIVTAADQKMQQQQPQTVQEILLSNHKQMQAQRLEFTSQLEEQQRQHELDIRQLKGSNGTIMPCQSQETLSMESELSRKVSQLTQENGGLKEKLAQQDQSLDKERSRRAEIMRVPRRSSSCSKSYQREESPAGYHMALRSPSEVRVLTIGDTDGYPAGSMPLLTPMDVQGSVQLLSGVPPPFQGGSVRAPYQLMCSGSEIKMFGDPHLRSAEILPVLQGGSAGYPIALGSRFASSPRLSLNAAPALRPATPGPTASPRKEQESQNVVSRSQSGLINTNAMAQASGRYTLPAPSSWVGTQATACSVPPSPIFDARKSVGSSTYDTSSNSRTVSSTVSSSTSAGSVMLPGPSPVASAVRPFQSREDQLRYSQIGRR